MENILQKTNTTSYRKNFMFWKQICFPKNIFFFSKYYITNLLRTKYSQDLSSIYK